MDANKMGAFIASIRKEKGMTQAELAAKLFLSDKTISKWERGAGLPDIGNLEALADALGVTLVELMQSERSNESSISTQAAEQLLADTLCISKSSGAVRRGLGVAAVSVSVLAAAAVLILLLQNGAALLFPAASIILGLAAWTIPVWRITRGSVRGAPGSVLASMGLAGAAVCAQLFDICQNVMAGDWAAVDDTISALCPVVLAFMAISVLLNILMLSMSKVKRQPSSPRAL